MANEISRPLTQEEIEALMEADFMGVSASPKAVENVVGLFERGVNHVVFNVAENEGQAVISE